MSDALTVIGLALLAPASIWAIYAGASAIIANRRALQLVALRFTASRTATGAAECRLCGAPLPASGALVVACQYCVSPNVLGIDLRSEARSAVADEEELRSALTVNVDRRARALVEFGLAASCAIVAAIVFAVGCLVG